RQKRHGKSRAAHLHRRRRWRRITWRCGENCESCSRRRSANFHGWRRNAARFIDSGKRRQRRDELCKGFGRASSQIKTKRRTFARSGGGDGRVLSTFGKWTTHNAAGSE